MSPAPVYAVYPVWLGHSMPFLENEMGQINLSHHWTWSVSVWVLPTSTPCYLLLAPRTTEAGLWAQKTKPPWLLTSSALAQKPAFSWVLALSPFSLFVLPGVIFVSWLKQSHFVQTCGLESCLSLGLRSRHCWHPSPVAYARHWLRAVCWEVTCGKGVRSGPVKAKSVSLASALALVVHGLPHCKMSKISKRPRDEVQRGNRVSLGIEPAGPLFRVPPFSGNTDCNCVRMCQVPIKTMKLYCSYCWHHSVVGLSFS